MEIRLALLTRPGPQREGYLAALDGLAQVESAPTVAQFLDLLRLRPFHGLLIDIPSQLRAQDGQREKDELALILSRLPTARLNWRAESQSISVLVLGASTAGDYSLADFVENQCLPQASTPVRSSKRIELHINLLLHPAPGGGEGQRAVTHNVSRGGCFIVTSQDWPLGARVWLSLAELPDQPPIQVEVRWSQPWGLARRLPGIGVMFMGLSLEQTQEIARLLGL